MTPLERAGAAFKSTHGERRVDDESKYINFIQSWLNDYAAGLEKALRAAAGASLPEKTAASIPENSPGPVGPGVLSPVQTLECDGQ